MLTTTVFAKSDYTARKLHPFTRGGKQILQTFSLFLRSESELAVQNLKRETENGGSRRTGARMKDGWGKKKKKTPIIK